MYCEDDNRRLLGARQILRRKGWGEAFLYLKLQLLSVKFPLTRSLLALQFSTQSSATAHYRGPKLGSWVSEEYFPCSFLDTRVCNVIIDPSATSGCSAQSCPETCDLCFFLPINLLRLIPAIAIISSKYRGSRKAFKEVIRMKFTDGL